MSFGCLPGFADWDCSMIWITWTALFFISAILRRQIGENLGQSFSLIGALALGIVANIVFLYLPYIGGIKFAVLAGIIGVVIGGFFGGAIGLPDGQAGD